MKRFTTEQVAELLSFGREQNGVEFKGPGRRGDKRFFTKVTRAMIGMANRRYGGTVVIGVSEAGDTIVPTGLSKDEIGTWKSDEVADLLATYTEPSISFDLQIVDYLGVHLVVIHVSEFQETPIMCTKGFPEVLRDGAIYVRSQKKPETSDLPTHEDMRVLLDLATEKRLRSFLKTASNTGLLLSTQENKKTDEAKYADELKRANDQLN